MNSPQHINISFPNEAWKHSKGNIYEYNIHSVLLEYTPLVKFVRNHIWDSGIFHGKDIDDFIDTTFDPFMYLNMLVYDLNIFESSSEGFGNFRKMFANVRVCFILSFWYVTYLSLSRRWKTFFEHSDHLYAYLPEGSDAFMR